nr:MAG TPA: Inhibitor of TRAP, regulated by-TRAP, AT, TRAP, tryptophan RNA-binding [Caudoviricetes sp.]
MKKISNEQELFELFCNDDTCFGEYQEPFLEIVHNEVWAANRRMAVAVKAELVSGKYSKRETKDIDFGTPCNTIVTLKAIKGALAKLPMVEDEEIEDVDCDECDGSGEVECEYVDKGGATHEVTADCPICFGSGYVDGEPKKTGEMVVDFSTPIKLGEAYFMGYRLDILAQAMELLGLETLTMTHHGGFGVGRAKACELQADGVRFLLAPMLVDDVPNMIEIEI